MTSIPKVSVVVLNWNGWCDTIKCLEALCRITYSNYQVVVVDNGSTDESLEKIRDWAKRRHHASPQSEYRDSVAEPLRASDWPNLSSSSERDHQWDVLDMYVDERTVTLIRCAKNTGYGGGNNVGIKYALAQGTDHVLILNNDVFVEQGFLEPLVEAMSEKRVGVVGPVIFSDDALTQRANTGMKMNYWLGRGRQVSHRYVDYLMGCCLLVDAQPLTELGGFYVPYFLNFEDVEFCLRARHAGWKVVCESRSRVWHKAHASLRRVPKAGYYSHRNKLAFMQRNGPWFLKYAFLVYYSSYLVFLGLRAMLTSRDAVVFWQSLADFWRGELGERTEEVDD